MDVMLLMEYFLISNTTVYHHMCVFFHTCGLYGVKHSHVIPVFAKVIAFTNRN